MIDRRLAGFLEEGLAIHIGTRNDRLEPDGARVTAVRVLPDGEHIVAFVPEVSSARVLPNLQANGQAAIVFVRPIDDRSCQAKGVFVGARPADETEREFVAAQWAGFLRTLDGIGLPHALFENWITWPSLAVQVRVTSLFDQTPGPGAGAPMA